MKLEGYKASWRKRFSVQQIVIVLEENLVLMVFAVEMEFLEHGALLIVVARMLRMIV